MRAHVLAIVLLSSASAAWAQTAPQPPSLEAAPESTAPFEQREAWCESYATWLVASTPDEDAPTPADVRPTQRYEVEFNSCKLDPQQYQRETRAEANLILESQTS